MPVFEGLKQTKNPTDKWTYIPVYDLAPLLLYFSPYKLFGISLN